MSSISEFVIKQQLGDGTYSKVFKAKRIVDGLYYAVKQVKIANLSVKEKENAINEIRILASINSPYVIQYKDAFMDENGTQLSIVMELADQGDLFNLIKNQQKQKKLLDEIQIWKAIYQICQGLNTLHKIGVVHRDLKSANVFLKKNEENEQQFIIGDLNVSKVAKNGLVLTQTGTPYYAAPEVWQDSPYDYKSDVWSLGCMYNNLNRIYEMCAFKPPFMAQDMQVLFKKICKGVYEPIPKCFSLELNSFLGLLLQTDPKKRLSSYQILEHQSIAKRFGFLNFMDQKEYKQNDPLLDTIRLPLNLKNLKNRLPKAKYTKNNQSLEKKDMRIKIASEHQKQTQLKDITYIRKQFQKINGDQEKYVKSTNLTQREHTIQEKSFIQDVKEELQCYHNQKLYIKNNNITRKSQVRHDSLNRQKEESNSSFINYIQKKMSPLITKQDDSINEIKKEMNQYLQENRQFKRIHNEFVGIFLKSQKKSKNFAISLIQITKQAKQLIINNKNKQYGLTNQDKSISGQIKTIESQNK